MLSWVIKTPYALIINNTTVYTSLSNNFRFYCKMKNNAPVFFTPPFCSVWVHLLRIRGLRVCDQVWAKCSCVSAHEWATNSFYMVNVHAQGRGGPLKVLLWGPAFLVTPLIQYVMLHLPYQTFTNLAGGSEYPWPSLISEMFLITQWCYHRQMGSGMVQLKQNKIFSCRQNSECDTKNRHH